uniref:Uncharacterized protein n=1 Tax=Lepeophtheirus salmonis TaxID=72036 RepID=A0A0K2U7V5_LEPSM
MSVTQTHHYNNKNNNHSLTDERNESTTHYKQQHVRTTTLAKFQLLSLQNDHQLYHCCSLLVFNSLIQYIK